MIWSGLVYYRGRVAPLRVCVVAAAPLQRHPTVLNLQPGGGLWMQKSEVTARLQDARRPYRPFSYTNMRHPTQIYTKRKEGSVGGWGMCVGGGWGAVYVSVSWLRLRRHQPYRPPCRPRRAPWCLVVCLNCLRHSGSLLVRVYNCIDLYLLLCTLQILRLRFSS
jgi:hypothetical protein